MSKQLVSVSLICGPAPIRLDRVTSRHETCRHAELPSKRVAAGDALSLACVKG